MSINVVIDGVKYIPAPPVCENPGLLDQTFTFTDIGVSTVREYLTKVLQKLWREGDCFNSKRPFGSSGWHVDFYQFLAEAGVLGECKTMFDGREYFLTSTQELKASEIMEGLIAHMCAK